MFYIRFLISQSQNVSTALTLKNRIQQLIVLVTGLGAFYGCTYIHDAVCSSINAQTILECSLYMNIFANFSLSNFET